MFSSPSQEFRASRMKAKTPSVSTMPMIERRRLPSLRFMLHRSSFRRRHFKFCNCQRLCTWLFFTSHRKDGFLVNFVQYFSARNVYRAAPAKDTLKTRDGFYRVNPGKISCSQEEEKDSQTGEHHL